MRAVVCLCGLLWVIPVWAATDFDAVALLDDCAPEESPLSNGGQWTVDINGTEASVMETFGGLCRRDAVGTRGATYWNAATFGPYAAIVLEMPTDGDSTGDGIQMWPKILTPGSTAVDGYLCAIRTVDDEIDVVRLDDNTANALTSCTTLSDTIDAGDSVACQYLDNVLTAWVKRGSVWTEECSLADSTYSTEEGYIGFSVNDDTFRLDNIRAGTLTGTPAATTIEGLLPMIP